uniref:Uncharacterized protein AlNc14C11G1321 n=1 Tax=Albugo laibachii Nc14 TaxID=890382 RepID=F0W2U1_9STRA|nr:conserved hypothetical protein [Albugo laibachii Nc14]|eukprot:CCA15377.1 conserved hypothetical protein [Albugo laibachii Nc14]
MTDWNQWIEQCQDSHFRNDCTDLPWIDASERIESCILALEQNITSSHQTNALHGQREDDGLSYSYQVAKTESGDVEQCTEKDLYDVRDMADVTLASRELLGILRFLRIVCVDCEANQNQCHHFDILSKVHRVLRSCSEWIDIEDKAIQNQFVRIIQVALQFSVNYLVRNKANQDKAWKLFFPDGVQKLLVECHAHRKVVAFTVALLYNCVHAQENLREDLVSCRSLLVTLLHRFFGTESKAVDTSGEESETPADPAKEWLWILFRYLYNCGHFSDIYNSMGANLLSKLCSRVTPEQLIFLRVMEQLIQAKDTSANTEESNDHLQDIYEFAINVFKILIQQSDDDRPEDTEEARKLVWLGLENESKLLLLNILGHLSQLDLIRMLASSEGLVCLLIHELHRQWELDPQSTRSNFKTNKEGDIRVPPGYRSHMIAVIGNLCYRARVHQDLLRRLGGIPLVLNHCIIDERNPLIREWSLVAIRNICEDNAENQQFIASLKQQDAGTDSTCAHSQQLS